MVRMEPQGSYNSNQMHLQPIPESRACYEVLVLLPPGTNARPMARIRATLPQWLAEQLGSTVHLLKSDHGSFYFEQYWNTSSEGFFSALAGIANRWQPFFEDHMHVDIPDAWLLDAA